MYTVLAQARFAYVQQRDKDFISAFNKEMKNLGDDFGKDIGSGYWRSKYIILYKKSGVKSSKPFYTSLIRKLPQ